MSKLLKDRVGSVVDYERKLHVFYVINILIDSMSLYCGCSHFRILVLDEGARVEIALVVD